MNNKSQAATEEVQVKDTQNPVVIIDNNGRYVGANEEALELHCREKKELLGLTGEETVTTGKMEAGACLQRVLSGEKVKRSNKIRCGDGSVVECHSVGVPIEVDGETYAKIIIKESEEVQLAAKTEKTDASVFDDITEVELEQLGKNIRVETPEGEVPLNTIMLDLAVGHNELEQYKNGALTLAQALDERLVEEEKNNPDSKTADVLREVKRSARGLYLRLQRGDEELHGNREGKYSGYFN